MWTGHTSNRTGLRAAFSLALALTLGACSGTKEVGITADAMGAATPAMIQRVDLLKNQQAGLAQSYNALKAITIDRHKDVHTYLCRAAAAESRGSLYQGHAGALDYLAQEFDTAANRITDTIDSGLQGLNSEIARQKSIRQQQGQMGNLQPLTGQYADIVYIALLSERASLRAKGVINSISGLQLAAAGARQQLVTYVREQAAAIATREQACLADTAFLDTITLKLGPDAIPTTAQYEVLKDYLTEVSVAASALKLYAETNNLFGSNGLLSVLASGALGTFNTMGAEGQPGAPENVSATALKTSVIGAVSNLLAPAKAAFSTFSTNSILNSLGLQNISGAFDTALKKVKDSIASGLSDTLDTVKSKAEAILSTGNRN